MTDHARVVLIGGPPGAGKTTLARALATRLGYAHLTVDDLLVGVRALTTPQSHPPLHLMPDGHLAYFTDSSPEALVADAIALEEASWPAVQRVITSHVRSAVPIVIDWWLLSPRRMAALDERDVAALWLRIDPDALWDRERSNTDWMAGSHDPSRMLENFMHRSLWRNDHDATEAAAVGFPVLHLDGTEPTDALVDQVLDTFARR